MLLDLVEFGGDSKMQINTEKSMYIERHGIIKNECVNVHIFSSQLKKK